MPTNNEPLIVALSVVAGIVLFVAVIWIIRWATRKPSTQLPPPRPSFLTAYSTNRPGGHRGTACADDEAKLPSTAFAPYEHSGPPSDSSQLALWRAPDGEYYHDRARDSWPVTLESEAASLTTDHKPRHAASTPSPLNGSPLLCPQSPIDNSSPSTGVLSSVGPQKDASAPGSSEEVVKADTPFTFASEVGHRLPTRSGSPLAGSLPSMGMHRSRNSVAVSLHQGSLGHVPPSNTIPSRRLSRQSVYSIAANTQDPPRVSIRGAPHKTNMQIILPEPLAPLAARNSGLFNTSSFPNDAFVQNRSQSVNSNRRSRADLWTEANSLRSRLPPGTEPGRPRRKSRESTDSGSFETPSQLARMEAPPLLPTFSRSGTPNSFASGRSEGMMMGPPPPLPSPSPASTLAEQPQPVLVHEQLPMAKDTPPATTKDLPPLPPVESGETSAPAS